MSEEQSEEYQQALALCFGAMDPCDWAATLSYELAAAAKSLKDAQITYADQSKDRTQATDAEDLIAIRLAVGAYLRGIWTMLHSMPMIQSQPQILEALRFIIAGVADVDRGNRAEWLGPVATKKHPKPLGKEAEWVPIIAALELLLLDPRFATIDRAAKEIARRTDRTVGTTKDWYQKLRRRGKRERPAAWEAIEQTIRETRTLLSSTEKEGRPLLIERSVNALLG